MEKEIKKTRNEIKKLLKETEKELKNMGIEELMELDIEDIIARAIK